MSHGARRVGLSKFDPHKPLLRSVNSPDGGRSRRLDSSGDDDNLDEVIPPTRFTGVCAAHDAPAAPLHKENTAARKSTPKRPRMDNLEIISDSPEPPANIDADDDGCVEISRFEASTNKKRYRGSSRSGANADEPSSLAQALYQRGNDGMRERIAANGEREREELKTRRENELREKRIAERLAAKRAPEAAMKRAPEVAMKRAPEVAMKRAPEVTAKRAPEMASGAARNREPGPGWDDGTRKKRTTFKSKPQPKPQLKRSLVDETLDIDWYTQNKPGQRRQLIRATGDFQIASSDSANDGYNSATGSDLSDPANTQSFSSRGTPVYESAEEIRPGREPARPTREPTRPARAPTQPACEPARPTRPQFAIKTAGGPNPPQARKEKAPAAFINPLKRYNIPSPGHSASEPKTKEPRRNQPEKPALTSRKAGKAFVNPMKKDYSAQSSLLDIDPPTSDSDSESDSLPTRKKKPQKAAKPDPKPASRDATPMEIPSSQIRPEDSLGLLSTVDPDKCAICNATLPSNFITSYRTTNDLAPDTVFDVNIWDNICQSHRRISHLKTWRVRGYPKDIAWAQLGARALRHEPVLVRIIEGTVPAPWRDAFEKQTRKIRGFAAQLLKNTTGKRLQLPGYYGPRGSAILLHTFTRHFGNLVRQAEKTDNIIALGGASAFIQAVLVPEAAVRLIAEDMGTDEDEARLILDDSMELGVFFNSEEHDDDLYGADDKGWVDVNADQNEQLHKQREQDRRQWAGEDSEETEGGYREMDEGW